MEYTIQQAAKKMKLTTYTIRYYDREGLLPHIERSKAGNRIFSKYDMDMLVDICCLKNTGMQIKDIKKFTDRHHEGDHTLHERQDMLMKHKEAVLAQLAELQSNLQMIDRKLLYYQDACAAYDSGLPVPCCSDYTKLE